MLQQNVDMVQQLLEHVLSFSIIDQKIAKITWDRTKAVVAVPDWPT